MKRLLTTAMFATGSLFVQATFGQTTTDATGGNERSTTTQLAADSSRLPASDLGISISPASLTGNGSVAVSVTLPASTCTDCNVDRLVVLKASDAACSIPVTTLAASRTVPSQSYSLRIQGDHSTTLTGSVTASCSTVPTDRSVKISEVSSSVIPASASLALIAPDLGGLAMRPESVASGSVGTGRAKLNTLAITDMTVTLLSANSELAGVPATVVIPAGKSYADFPIKVGMVSAETVVRIDASCTNSGKSTTQRARLTILPAQ